jgi:hypothetical protein
VRRLKLRLDGVNERGAFVTVYADDSAWHHSGSLILPLDWLGETGPLNRIEPMGDVEVEVETGRRPTG